MAEKRTLLTREYLQFLGIKDVSEDGTVIGASGRPIAVRDNGHKYKVMGFNRAELGKPFNLYIHHIVWAWFNGRLEPDTDIHHKDKNPANNALSNLIAMSHSEHLRMHKLERQIASTRELKCQLNKPRSFLEEKLAKYEAEYLTAPSLYGKSTHPKYKAIIANINNTRARLRYYDSHIDEVNEIKETTKMTLEEKIAKEQDRKDLQILQYWKKVFRDAGNKKMWHHCCDVEKMWKKGELNQLAKNHVIEVLLGLKK